MFLNKLFWIWWQSKHFPHLMDENIKLNPFGPNRLYNLYIFWNNSIQKYIGRFPIHWKFMNSIGIWAKTIKTHSLFFWFFISVLHGKQLNVIKPAHWSPAWPCSAKPTIFDNAILPPRPFLERRNCHLKKRNNIIETKGVAKKRRKLERVFSWRTLSKDRKRGNIVRGLDLQ